jgi:hypothetical protein
MAKIFAALCQFFCVPYAAPMLLGLPSLLGIDGYLHPQVYFMGKKIHEISLVALRVRSVLPISALCKCCANNFSCSNEFQVTRYISS